MPLALLFHYLMLNMFRMLIHVGLSLFNYQDDARSNKHMNSLKFFENCVTVYQGARRNIPEDLNVKHYFYEN